jgi:hypothetical protein
MWNKRAVGEVIEDTISSRLKLVRSTPIQGMFGEVLHALDKKEFIATIMEFQGEYL